MSDTLTLNNSHNIYEAFNLKEKVYPSGLVKQKKYSYDILKGRLQKNRHNGTSTEEQLEKYLKKRVKERREKIIDLAFSNSWEYFVTFTYDSKDKDNFPNGYTHKQAIELMKKWLNNQRHKNNDMIYLLVSEFHKESGHLHFHGLFSHVRWDLSVAINSKTNKPLSLNGTPIYNLNDYEYGFTTISEIQDSKKVSIYLSKYITKDLVSLKDSKVFWHSRNLSSPKIMFKYIDVSLHDYLSSLENVNVTYYNQFEHNNSTIEVSTMTK